MKLTVLSARDALRWEKTLSQFPAEAYTVFHTPAYVLSWQDHEQGEPACLLLESDGVFFLYPFYLLPCPYGDGGPERWDMVSAYGYGGMVCSRPDCDPALLDTANQTVDKWCTDQGVVAEFIREYPFPAYLRRSRTLHVRDNLLFQYGPQPMEFAAGIKKRARRDARLSARKGCTVDVDRDLRTLDSFQEMYADLADRKGFFGSHGFSTAYFQGVRRHLSGMALLVNIAYTGRTMATALCLLYRGMLVYHLSASAHDAAPLLSNDLLLYTMLELGAQAGCRTLFLGGGLNADEDDSLFRFKEKFANERVRVHIGTKVHDQNEYERLCGKWEQDNPDKAGRFANFFLKYRQ